MSSNPGSGVLYICDARLGFHSYSLLDKPGCVRAFPTRMTHLGLWASFRLAFHLQGGQRCRGNPSASQAEPPEPPAPPLLGTDKSSPKRDTPANQSPEGSSHPLMLFDGF